MKSHMKIQGSGNLTIQNPYAFRPRYTLNQQIPCLSSMKVLYVKDGIQLFKGDVLNIVHPNCPIYAHITSVLTFLWQVEASAGTFGVGASLQFVNQLLSDPNKISEQVHYLRATIRISRVLVRYEDKPNARGKSKYYEQFKHSLPTCN